MHQCSAPFIILVAVITTIITTAIIIIITINFIILFTISRMAQLSKLLRLVSSGCWALAEMFHALSIDCPVQCYPDARRKA